MIRFAILITIFLTGAITIASFYPEKARRVYIFKPLTTLLILFLAIMPNSPPSPAYKQFVVAGILFSMAGDIILMFDKKYFIGGLASFLVAHIFYSIAFGGQAMFQLKWLALLPFLIAGILMGGYLWGGLGKMKIPAAFYIAAILCMGWMAANLWLLQPARWSMAALVGAILFVFSDAALAINRFRRPFHSSQFWVLGSYYAAQSLLALSVYGNEL